MIPWVLNSIWQSAARPESLAFRQSLSRVASTQSALLLSMVRRNRDTWFGRRHGFDRIDRVSAYQDAVPIGSAEELALCVDRIAAGERAVLTCEPVRLLEPTSGTTRAEKLIPYTRELKRQFRRMIAAWIDDLFSGRPQVKAGPAWWSITPMAEAARRTSAGIPIGFEDDADYLGPVVRPLARRLMVVPRSVVRLASVDAFRYATLCSLLAAPDMSLISVWSPTFLESILEPLERFLERICHDLRKGTFSMSDPAAAACQREFPWIRRPCARRAAEVESIFKSGGAPAGRLRALWPQLALISLWADGSAAAHVPRVASLFPSVELQPKGLLATEACVTFPLVGRAGGVLAIRSHFFEFLPSSGDAGVRLAHEVALGGRYQVMVTTGGGLYRYPLDDEVECVGFEGECPRFVLLGKADSVSDLCGEKLSEPHVRTVLLAAAARMGVTPRFMLLVPDLEPVHRYLLYVQCREADAGRLASEVDQGLCQNPQYAWARRVGQLGAVEAVSLDPSGESGWSLYERGCIRRGQRAGNVKPVALERRHGWRDDFAPAPRQLASGSPPAG
jgi:hypothetical protein